MMYHKTDENKIVTLVSDLTRIFKALVALEMIDDDRSYSSLDLLESINLTRDVIKDRITDGVDDWKDDEKHHHKMFFKSVKEQLKITITNSFILPGRKSPRFVDVYNTIVLDRLFDLFVEFGPQTALTSLDNILNMFVNVIQTDELDPLDVPNAQKTLSEYRKQSLQRKTLTKEQRLDLIYTICEKVKEQTA